LEAGGLITARSETMVLQMSILDNMKATAELADSAGALLRAVGDHSDLALLRSWGNRGDDLISAGNRRLLRHLPYREYDIRKFDQAPSRATAIISGGGSWCKPYHLIAELLPYIEARFSHVIVFPSSFDIDEPIVRESLSLTHAVVFAREDESYERIRFLCDARLAHDTAFFFDFAPYQSGFHQGVLSAFRTDEEAAGMPVPEGNRDISSDCETLDEWLWTISRHDLIRTDRAHVVIAAAMLGKRVEWRPSSYHKLPGIVRFSISSSQVTPTATGDN
jgi:exopolysaccharide biosynthesis predicted pyruvyltransferase EpsI